MCSFISRFLFINTELDHEDPESVKISFNTLHPYRFPIHLQLTIFHRISKPDIKTVPKTLRSFLFLSIQIMNYPVLKLSL